MALVTTHSIFEIVCGSGYTADGRWFLDYENAHHICMLSGFFVSSLIEILMYYGIPFPKFTDYMFNLLAFLIQSLIMITHLEGDNDLEHMVHKLWTILCFFSFLGGLAETIRPDYYWAVYMRIFFFLAQGTWMFQIAFVVWPQTTNPAYIWHADHAAHVWLSISLMYHLIGCALALMIQYVFVYSMIGTIDKFYRRYEFDIEQDQQEQTFREKTTNASYRILLNETDENEKEQLI